MATGDGTDLPGIDQLSGLPDRELLALAREGDPAATETLVRRHHDAARRYARSLADEHTADDLVSDAFERVLATLRHGHGPREALRPYLLTTVRNAWVSRVRRDRRLVLVEDDAAAAPAPTGDGHDDRHESALLARAFHSLPERWQAVLWHTAVEDEDHATVGSLLGINANAVAALAFRAREGLRRAYLEAHLAEPIDDACRDTRAHLPAYVRGRMASRRRRLLEVHLDGCPACRAALRELVALNDRLGALLGPALLGVTTAAVRAGASSTGAPPTGRRRTEGGRTGPRVGAAAVAAALVVVAGGGFALTRVDRSASPDPDRETAALPSPVVSAAPEPPVASVPGPGRRATPIDRGGAGTAPVPAVPATAPVASAAAPSVQPPPVEPPPPGHEPSSEPAAPSTTPSTPPATPPPTTPPTTPPSTAPTVPAGFSQDDLALGQGFVSDFGPYRHVEVRPRSSVETAYVRWTVQDLMAWTVHREPRYRPASCSETASTGAVTEIVCRVGPGTDPLGLDLTVTGPLRLSATVYAERNVDPVPGNDGWTVRS